MQGGCHTIRLDNSRYNRYIFACGKEIGEPAEANRFCGRESAPRPGANDRYPIAALRATVKNGGTLRDAIQRPEDPARRAGRTALWRNRQPHDYPRSGHYAITGPP